MMVVKNVYYTGVDFVLIILYQNIQIAALILQMKLASLKNPPNHETDPYLPNYLALYLAENAYIAG